MKTAKKFSMVFVVVLGLLVLSGPVFAEWTEPVLVDEVNTQYVDGNPFLSFDGLKLYFDRSGTSSFYFGRIYEASRAEPTGPFTIIKEVSELNSSSKHVIWPWVSPDNLRMYYSKSVARIIFSERTSTSDLWPIGTDITELNALGKIYHPALTADELIILFHSKDIFGGQGSYDIWMATRPDRNSAFTNVTNLTEINSSASEGDAFVSPDGLTIYFNSNRDDGIGRLYMATRESLTEPFGNIEVVFIPNAPEGGIGGPALSSDGSALYFHSRDPSTQKADIWVSYWEEDLYEVALANLEEALVEKLTALETIEAALAKELAAYEALEQMLESGEYGDLKKGDIVKAKQKIHSAMRQQERSAGILQKSIEKLDDALESLGYEPPVEEPAQE